MARLSSLLVLGAMAASFAAAEDIQYCGKAPYYPSQYTCYDSSFLCPKINSDPTLRCGDACYLPTMYSCSNNTLSTLPAADTPFIVHASNPSAPFNGKKIEAGGLKFWIGPDAPATYCPSPAEQAGACRGVANETIFYAGSGLDVMVPGGQAYYIGPDGALGYTQAHSAYSPPGSVFGVSAFKDGAFVYLPGGGWFACPANQLGGQRWGVYQKLPGVTLASDCIGFNANIESVPSGTVGAWQYT